MGREALGKWLLRFLVSALLLPDFLGNHSVRPSATSCCPLPRPSGSWSGARTRLQRSPPTFLQRDRCFCLSPLAKSFSRPGLRVRVCLHTCRVCPLAARPTHTPSDVVGAWTTPSLSHGRRLLPRALHKARVFCHRRAWLDLALRLLPRLLLCPDFLRDRRLLRCSQERASTPAPQDAADHCTLCRRHSVAGNRLRTLLVCARRAWHSEKFEGLWAVWSPRKGLVGALYSQRILLRPSAGLDATGARPFPRMGVDLRAHALSCSVGFTEGTAEGTSSRELSYLERCGIFRLGVPFRLRSAFTCDSWA